MTINDLFVYY